jgi:hypothetical protein
MNIGRDLHYHDTTYGVYWKVLAAFGILSNLQVTSPIVTFALRDMISKVLMLDATVMNQRLIVVAVLAVLTPVAVLLRGNFAAVCSLIGSVAVIANSILLPVVFYHTVHRSSAGSDGTSNGVSTSGIGAVGHAVSVRVWWLHGLILVVAVTSTVLGIYANFKQIL